MRFCEEGKLLLSEEPTSFLVVGVLGAQGVGKSTIMSELYQRQKILFPKQKSIQMETLGVDLAVTPERVILLDCQALRSSAALERLIKTDAAMPPGVSTHEQLEEHIALQLALFMFAVCHVVIVVQSKDSDPDLWKFLLLADSLRLDHFIPLALDKDMKPRKRESGQALLVVNKCAEDVFNKAAQAEVATCAANIFQECQFWNTALSADVSSVVANRKRLFFLPKEGSELDFGFRGTPRFEVSMKALLNEVLSWPRTQLYATQNPTEREWWHFASKTWALLQKYPLLREWQAQRT